MFNMGFQELLIVGIVAILLFGKRLPEVARSLGHSYQQFRQGLNDIKSEMDHVSYSVKSTVSSATTPRISHQQPVDEPTAPVFTIAEPSNPSDKTGESDDAPVSS